MTPQQFAVYKGTGGKFGALQFDLQLPHYYKDKQKDYTGEQALDGFKTKEGWNRREGAVFLQATTAVDKNVYDWEKKIIFALSVQDMAKVVLSLSTGEECKLMHDPGAKSDTAGAIKKYLNISSPNGTVNGCMVTLSQTSGGETRRHTVPMDGSEVIALRQLLLTAIPRALGW